MNKIDLLKSGDVIFSSKDPKYDYIHSIDGVKIYIDGDKIKYIHKSKSYIDWTKTGVYLIKRLWFEERLNKIYIKQEFSPIITKDKFNLILVNDHNMNFIQINGIVRLFYNIIDIDVDRTLESYLKENYSVKIKNKTEIYNEFEELLGINRDNMNEEEFLYAILNNIKEMKRNNE